MRKLIIFLAVLAAAVSGLNLSAQFRYGPMVGVTVTDLKFKQDLISIDKSVGFSAGVATELMFPGIGFGVDAGLFTSSVVRHLIWDSVRCGLRKAMARSVPICIILRFRCICVSNGHA